MSAQVKNVSILRQVQQYRWQPGDELKRKGKRPVHPGFCEAADGSCCNVAAACFVPTGGGRSINLCSACVEEMKAAGMIEGGTR